MCPVSADMACKRKEDKELASVKEENIVLSDKYDVENDPNYSEELVHWMQQQVEQEIKVIESKGTPFSRVICIVVLFCRPQKQRLPPPPPPSS